MTTDEVKSIITEVAFLSEKVPKSLTPEEATKLASLQSQIQENFVLFFTKLTDSTLGAVLLQEDDFNHYQDVSISKKSKPPEIPDHELSREHLEDLSRKVTQSYNTVAGVLAEISAIVKTWEIKIKRAERIIKVMAGAGTVDKGNNLVALVMPEKILARYDEYVYWEELFKTKLETLKNSKEVISNLVKMYCIDFTSSRDKTVTERPELKTAPNSRFRDRIGT
jgi:hypothetical protein